MRPSILILGVLLAVATGTGCSKKQVDTSDLTQVFQTPGGAAEAHQDSSTNQAAKVTVQSSLEQAVAAIKAEDYPAAAMQLQVLRAQPTLTAQQLTAVQDTMAAVQQKLVAKIEQGDLAALKAAEELRRARRAQRQR